MTDRPLVGVRVNRSESRAALTLCHPKGNILTAAMIAALRSALDSLAHRDHLKLITIEGDGADFSFGASVPEHAPDRIRDVLPQMHRLIEDLLEAPAVTAAIVRGRCLGGGFELALACDLIFAARTAQVGLPEITLGVFPPAAAALLPARIGYTRATRAIVTGEVDWKDTGLVEVVAPPEALEGEVERWAASHLENKSAAALRHAIKAARLGLLAHVRATLPALERLYLDDLMGTRDAAEGIRAFVEKRAPVWRDE